jgi:hypothetical protein
LTKLSIGAAEFDLRGELFGGKKKQKAETVFIFIWGRGLESIHQEVGATFRTITAGQ